VSRSAKSEALAISLESRETLFREGCKTADERERESNIVRDTTIPSRFHEEFRGNPISSFSITRSILKFALEHLLPFKRPA
jgi:hypothetical protein